MTPLDTSHPHAQNYRHSCHECGTPCLPSYVRIEPKLEVILCLDCIEARNRDRHNFGCVCQDCSA